MIAALLIALAPAAAGGARGALDAAAPDTWSAPTVLARCGALAAPAVAFPSEAPSSPSGPGAVAWLASEPCGGQGGAWGLSAAAIGAAERPAAAVRVAGGGAGPRGAAAEPGGPSLSASGVSFGQVGLLASGAGAGASPVRARLFEGRAGAAIAPVASLAARGLPGQLTRAYLGDAVAVGLASGGRAQLLIQRHYDHAPERAVAVALASGRVTALTAALDFRSDMLLAWQQNGAVWARFLPAAGGAGPVQRLGPSRPAPVISALVSDNYHATVAWSTTTPAGAGAPRTRVFLSLSGSGVSFGAPRLLSSYADPLAAGRSPGSVSLVRLSTENVLLAWTTFEGGAYAVRAAQPASGLAHGATRLSAGGTQAILAGLAAGPAGDALVLWESPANAQSAGPAALWTDRAGIDGGTTITARTPVELAPPGRYEAPVAAVDPGSDRAVAAWIDHGPGGDTLDYAISGSRPGAGAAPAALAPGGGSHWVRIGGAALLAAGLAAAALVLTRLRHSRRRARPG